MTSEVETQLIRAAKDYIKEYGDSLEIFELIVPFDCIPEDEEDPEEWAAVNAPELDSSIGFKIVPISCGDDVKGYALLTVKGNSWEGLRIFVEGVFDSMSNARSHVEKLGITC